MTSHLYVYDLTKALESNIADGYRLEMIMPADSPRTALLSKDGEIVHLHTVATPTEQEFAIDDGGSLFVSRLGESSWVTGRAGMIYRELIPGRFGGRIAASHIRLLEGGEVSDYVHYHKIRFQVIYCIRGRIRVVYEDQGPPFWLEPGDCVVQPPEIRHRVLESTAGAEVLELGIPAEHETWVDYEMQLPTERYDAGRIFNGQLFARRIAKDAEWKVSYDSNCEWRDLEIDKATSGIGYGRVIRTVDGSVATRNLSQTNKADCCLYFVVGGHFLLRYEDLESRISTGNAIVIPKGSKYALVPIQSFEIVEILIPKFPDGP